MAVERDRLVTRGSLHANCPTVTATCFGGCLWRITAKPTG
jgi:hypothetical protein